LLLRKAVEHYKFNCTEGRNLIPDFLVDRVVELSNLLSCLRNLKRVR